MGKMGTPDCPYFFPIFMGNEVCWDFLNGSGVRRESHAQFWERLGMKFPHSSMDCAYFLNGDSRVSPF
jgi:hypothetical protein